jgi:inner membrane transporter RhtA
LLILWRPSVRGHARGDYLVAVLFGLALAAMNFTLYQALDRIPLGVAVTLEFVGPLGVAVAGSRRVLDLLWVVLAAAGIVLLAPLDVLGETDLDPVGVALALLAGCFWAAYILLSARTGSIFPGGTGLVIALCIGAVVLVPLGIAGGGVTCSRPPEALCRSYRPTRTRCAEGAACSSTATFTRRFRLPTWVGPGPGMPIS